jgi:hypothetical protein
MANTNDVCARLNSYANSHEICGRNLCLYGERAGAPSWSQDNRYKLHNQPIRANAFAFTPLHITNVELTIYRGARILDSFVSYNDPGLHILLSCTSCSLRAGSFGPGWTRSIASCRPEKEEREDSYDICRTRDVVLAGSPGSPKPEPFALFRSRTPHPLVNGRRFLGMNGN